MERGIVRSKVFHIWQWKIAAVNPRPGQRRRGLRGRETTAQFRSPTLGRPFPRYETWKFPPGWNETYEKEAAPTCAGCKLLSRILIKLNSRLERGWRTLARSSRHESVPSLSLSLPLPFSVALFLSLSRRHSLAVALARPFAPSLPPPCDKGNAHSDYYI